MCAAHRQREEAASGSHALGDGGERGAEAARVLADAEARAADMLGSAQERASRLIHTSADEQASKEQQRQDRSRPSSK